MNTRDTAELRDNPPPGWGVSGPYRAFDYGGRRREPRPEGVRMDVAKAKWRLGDRGGYRLHPDAWMVFLTEEDWDILETPPPSREHRARQLRWGPQVDPHTRVFLRASAEAIEAGGPWVYDPLIGVGYPGGGNA